MKLSRRNFFTQSTAGIIGVCSIPGIVSSCINDEKRRNSKYSLFTKDSTVLFQGDSITDAGREKKRELPNNSRSFGHGYAFLAASNLLNVLSNRNLVIYNRGISGNKVYQLAERWKKDCLDLKPDILSILIGVNDYWHMRNGKYNGTIEIYEKDYRALLQRTKDKLPGLKMVICEPYAVINTSVVDKTWIQPIKEYQSIAKLMAEEFDAIRVPFQKVFDEAVKHAPAKYWTPDGVHPSMAGAQLMAEAWLQSVAK